MFDILTGGGVGARTIKELSDLLELAQGDKPKIQTLLNMLTGAKVYGINVEEQKKGKLLRELSQKQYLLRQAQGKQRYTQ